MKKKNEKPTFNYHEIRVEGAREHNLKDINVAIPHNALTVITGPSGSGKSSLAFDVLFAEGSRRYLESLSSYARQFLGSQKKPDVDKIEGLRPSIAIEQKTVSSNPRSTVGTITEIYDYLRLLFARIGEPHCPRCKIAVRAESAETIAALLGANFDGQLVTITAPLAHEKKGEFKTQLMKLFHEGYYRVIIDGKQYKFTSEADILMLTVQKSLRHSIDIIIDAVTIDQHDLPRLHEAIDKAFHLAQGVCTVITPDGKKHTYSSARVCLGCGYSIQELEPRLFSFNSPIGACSCCDGLGFVYNWAHANSYGTETQTPAKQCPECRGQRLNQSALAVFVDGKNIAELSTFSIAKLTTFFESITLNDLQKEIATALLKELVNRLYFLLHVGLDYLSLSRTAGTLSGGEGQRIRLATQIGSALSGVLYILDEPSIGLHQRDNIKLIETLKKLRDHGNTVLVVEHDTDTIMHADHVIDMGPGAGVHGGHITAAGTPQELMQNKHSLTGAYLAGKRSIPLPTHLRKPKGYLVLHNAHKNNLRDITVQFPLGVLCGISGVSGSGKSTLIMDELVETIQYTWVGFARKFKQITNDKITGLEQLDTLVVVDQTPIGRTPHSNPATYLGIFDDIRNLYAQLPESNARGYTSGHFSFNRPMGRCTQCNGEGTLTISMHFLPDVSVICKTCKGKRYKQDILQIKYKDKNIADVLQMTAQEALPFFSAHAPLAKRLQIMCDVGLDYIQLGQPSTTLSGGEAQRIKLALELSKRGSNTLYILDEPTTGLHSHDIEKLLLVLNKLIDKGNSIIVIEHNLDVLKTADYLIDMGPEGGDAGGTVVAAGTPREVAHNKQSITGKFLLPYIKS